MLRIALLANAAFSATSGLMLVIAPDAVSTWMGLGAPWLFTAIGLDLLAFAAFVGWTATRTPIPRRVAVAISAMDLGWVAASAVLLAAGSGLLSTAGWLAVLDVALVVGAFAAMQLVGLRRYAAATRS